MFPIRGTTIVFGERLISLFTDSNKWWIAKWIAKPGEEFAQGIYFRHMLWCAISGFTTSFGRSFIVPIWFNLEGSDETSKFIIKFRNSNDTFLPFFFIQCRQVIEPNAKGLVHGNGVCSCSWLIKTQFCQNFKLLPPLFKINQTLFGWTRICLNLI